jgi:hypothetical protein
MGIQRHTSVALSVAALAGGLLFAAAPALATPPEAPEVTVESPVNINEANLHGVLNPKKAGEPGEYQFLYKASESKECKGGGVAPIPPGGAAGGEHEEPSQTLTGLAPNTEYAVCLREENLLGGESAVSPAVSFKTAEATAPVVASQSAAPTHASTTVSAQIDPGGLATTCEVRYGKTAALEATPVPCPTVLPAGDTEQTATVELRGIEPKTEYHFEFVATNAKGTTPAAEAATFTTGPYPPLLAFALAASEIKRTNAVLSGFVIPSEGENTVYYFEYGPEECKPLAETCGVKTATLGPVTGFTATELVKVIRLKAGATYHFWLVASGPGGTTHGAEMTFTTATAEPEEYVFDKDLEVEAPYGVAVNQATGDIYVSSDNNAALTVPRTIKQFNEKGQLQSSVKMPEGSGEIRQLAVDNSNIPGQQGIVYVADNTTNAVYKFAPNAKGELELDKTTPEIGKGNLSEPFGVAVDSNGDVYVASAGTGTVSEFSPTGALLSQSLITGIPFPQGLAVDTAGNIYVAELFSGVSEYTSAGACVNACTSIDSAAQTTAIALDSARGVFISTNQPATIHEYSPAEGHPPIANPVFEREGTIKKLPLGLAVNDKSHAIYVTEEDSSSLEVFRFLQAKPVVVKTESASQVSGPVAVEELRGTVNPAGQEPAEYYFEYGTSPCLAETCGTVAVEPSQTLLYGDEPIPVSARLDNLAPDTTYHYWVVGVNEESGLEHGAEQTFTTGSEPTPAPGPPSEGSAPTSSAPASSPVYPLLTGIKPVPMPPVPIKKKLTRAPQLATALATCNRKPKKQRAACKRQARKQYGPVTKGVAKQRRK